MNIEKAHHQQEEGRQLSKAKVEVRCTIFGYRGRFIKCGLISGVVGKYQGIQTKSVNFLLIAKFFPCFKDILYLLYFCSFLYVFVWVISYQQQSQQCLGVCGVPATLSLRHRGGGGSLYVLLISEPSSLSS